MSRSSEAARGRIRPVLLRALAAAGALVVVVLLPAAPAAAHAVLVASQPANGAVLARAPSVISLRFSEDISARFSSATLLDGAGRPVAGTHITAGAGPRVLALAVPSLPAARYGVAWRVLAEDDGHSTGGVLVFTIGGGGQFAAGSAPQAADAPAGPAAPDVARRWLGLCLLAGLIGGLVFAGVVLRPGADESLRVALAGRRRKVLTLSAVAGVLSAVAGLADPLAQAARSGAANPSTVATLLVDTRWGELWLIREAALVALVVLTVRLRARSARTEWIYAGILVAAVVMIEALSGHAASTGTGRAVAVVAVAVHALTAFVWLGGVAALALVLAGPTLPGLYALVRNRFMVPAFTCVALVVATGLYRAGREVASVHALVDSAYGRTLLIKSGVLMVVAGLGLANARRRRPGLSRRLVAAEVAVGVVLLLAAGALVETPPARDAATPAGAVTSVTRSATVDDLVVSLTVTPNRVGASGVTVLAASGRRPPPAPIGDVTVELADAGVPLQQVEPGRYFGTADLMSPGVTRATVVIRRGTAALSVVVDWSVLAAPPAARPPRNDLAPIVNVLAILLLGVLAYALWRVVQARRRRPAGAPTAEIEPKIPQEVR